MKLPDPGYDIVVSGGGAAGIAAAVSAARSGATVALIENHSFLGGKATAANVGTVCGLYLRNQQQQLRYASNGFAREFGERLQQKSSTQALCNKDGLWFLPYKPFAFKKLCDDLVRENRIDLFLHSVVCEVKEADQRIQALKAFSYDRLISIQADAVIDCTGEAVISKLLGLPVVECDEYQAAAQVFAMEGLTEFNTGVLQLALIRDIKKAVENGRLDPDLENITIVPGSHQGGQVSIKVGIPIAVGGQLNKITPLELAAREMIEKVAVFLQSEVSGFRNAAIASTAPEIGIRTGRRAIGKSELTRQDVLGAVKHMDGIANGAWPVEHWKVGKRVQMQYFAEDDFYQVPAGCLQSDGCKNLYFAGRHLSAMNDAIASARVIGTCLATGYAAGQLASGMLNGTDQLVTIGKIRSAQVMF